MNILNTNLTIKDGAYFIEFCENSNGTGKRLTVLTYEPKKAIKTYLKAGYFTFGNAFMFENDNFWCLTKSLKVMSRNNYKIQLGNAMYYIQNLLNKSILKLF